MSVKRNVCSAGIDGRFYDRIGDGWPDPGILTPMSDGGSVLNFAYGSNLCAERLLGRVPSARYEYGAHLRGYQIRFHKRGRLDGSGKASIWQTGSEEDVVWGAVVSLSGTDKTALDGIEGLGLGYAERDVCVVNAQRTEETVSSYVASPSHVDDSLLPFGWYLDLVVAGATAHDLPEWYIEGLRATPTKTDPDRGRAERNRARCDL